MREANQAYVARNVEAFRSLLTLSKVQPSQIVECFGGMGNQTRCLRDLYPLAKHTVFEIDAECCKAIRKVAKGKAGITQGDFFKLGKRPVCEDSLLVFDSNVFSLAEANWQRIKLAFGLGYRWVIGTDHARGKLHLNYKSYGLSYASRNHYPSYLELFEEKTREEVGYQIVRAVKAPKSLTYILWEKL